MQKLVNDDPPLVHKFSNPVKVRLTPEGEALAARLYAIAVTTGEVENIPGFDAAETLAEAARNAPSAAAIAGGASTSAAAAAAAAGEEPAKAAPKRKAKATKTSKATGAAEAAAACPAGVPAEEDVCVIDDKPVGRGVARSMGAKVAAAAQKSKKRRRAPMPLEDLPDSPKGTLL